MSENMINGLEINSNRFFMKNLFQFLK